MILLLSSIFHLLAFLFNQQPTTKNQPTNNQTTNHQVPKNILLLTFPALQRSWVVSVDVFYLIQKTRSWVISVDGVFDLLPSLKRRWVISVDGLFDFPCSNKGAGCFLLKCFSIVFTYKKGAGWFLLMGFSTSYLLKKGAGWFLLMGLFDFFALKRSWVISVDGFFRLFRSKKQLGDFCWCVSRFPPPVKKGAGWFMLMGFSTSYLL